ncbi:MAG: MFS transporter [Clostridia bacterium]|nr:MFS transporter [Clostridia bacterium]
MENKKAQLNSMALYFCAYFSLGAFCPLLSQYLSSIGFSGSQVGVVTSLGTLGAVVSGLFMGKLYANSNSKKLVIIVSFVLAAVLSLVSSLVRTFVLFAVSYFVLHSIQEPVHSLCDSMIDSNGQNFAVIRSLGAVGYAVASYTAGLVANSYGLKTIFYFNGVFYLLSALFVIREKEPPHYSNRQEKASISDLFKEKKFVMLLIVAFFSLGSTLANNTYYAYLYREAGGDVAGVGLAFLLMAGSEMVFMVLIPFFERRFPIQKLIAVAFAVAIIRFGIYACGPSTGVLIGTFFLQGIMDGFLLVEMVKYFGRIVPPRLRSIAVTTYYALGSNFSAIICNLVGGVILDHFGARGVYLFFTALQFIALVLYFLFGLQKEIKK